MWTVKWEKAHNKGCTHTRHTAGEGCIPAADGWPAPAAVPVAAARRGPPGRGQQQDIQTCEAMPTDFNDKTYRLVKQDIQNS